MRTTLRIWDRDRMVLIVLQIPWSSSWLSVPFDINLEKFSAHTDPSNPLRVPSVILQGHLSSLNFSKALSCQYSGPLINFDCFNLWNLELGNSILWTKLSTHLTCSSIAWWSILCPIQQLSMTFFSQLLHNFSKNHRAF